VIDVTGDLVSRPYVEMTAAVMRDFGVPTTWWSASSIRCRRRDTRPSGTRWSPTPRRPATRWRWQRCSGGTVTVPGWVPVSQQGDARFAESSAEMGCEVIATEADSG
jgi:3-phosphoshikimate 1-carboxyvinyltransferase